MQDIHAILKEYWGYDQFRSLQEEIIQSVLDGKDTLALLPTGGGKSICFQVPTIAKQGLCIVISPLIALMKDQVYQLTKRDIKAVAIYSGMSYREINYTLDNCIHGDIKFLYVSPERLKTELFRERLKQMQVSLLAVDEAHCISQWGYDFRPEYLQIAEVRDILKGVPILALTASATPRVVNDIQEKLLFKKKNVFIKSFERSNISYSVSRTEDKYNKLVHILSKVQGSALVYVRNRRRTQEIAQILQNHHIQSDFYHAGLSHTERTKKQDAWIGNHTRVMVCTNAFGMGIDKPDVRLVVHYEIPESLESYYQEAGRAGRDENKSYCVLLYNQTDEREALERLELSYPVKEDLKRVYQALCNYYALPTGASPDRSFDFNMSEFCQRFNVKPLLVYPALKALEQCDLVVLADGFFESSKMRIIWHADEVYKFQVEHPAYDNFIKFILRNYGGMFDQYVQIDENLLANRAKTNKETIVKYLNKLAQIGMVEYIQQKETPQITFLQDRISVNHLDSSLKMVVDRKAVALEKLESMIQYANNDALCRSKKLVNYFDDYGGLNCGICDVCIQHKKTDLSPERFADLIAHIKQHAGLTPIAIKEIVKKINGYKQENITDTISYLLDNDKLRYDKNKLLFWNE
jgi:ATP-dependent DNA helicase RecQ